jgi:hypothetical protein
MMGHDLNGHVPTKFQREALEHTGLAVAKIGEVNTNLADHVAGRAPHSLDCEDDPNHFVADDRLIQRIVNDENQEQSSPQILEQLTES